MNRWKLISGVVLVFVLGVLVGSMGTGLYVKHRFVPSKRDPKARKAFIMEKLSKELDLTQSQKTRIGKIVSQMVDRRREYFVKRRPEIKRIMDHGFSQIRKELNSDQQKKLDALRERFEKRRKAGA
jgi:ATP-dependent Lon protease